MVQQHGIKKDEKKVGYSLIIKPNGLPVEGSSEASKNSCETIDNV